MQLTLHTDYALRVLVYLALQTPGARVIVTDIAEHFAVPRNHLVKVVHRLGQLGYLRTTRGKNGGIALQREPTQINVGRLIRDMEAKLDIIDCLRPAPCPILPVCRLKGILNQARDAFLHELDRYTLADLVSQPQSLGNFLSIAVETS